MFKRIPSTLNSRHRPELMTEEALSAGAAALPHTADCPGPNACICEPGRRETAKLLFDAMSPAIRADALCAGADSVEVMANEFAVHTNVEMKLKSPIVSIAGHRVRAMADELNK